MKPAMDSILITCNLFSLQTAHFVYVFWLKFKNDLLHVLPFPYLPTYSSPQYVRQNKNRSFIQIVCLTTGPKPLLKRALHIVRSRASSFKWEYPLLSLRSSSSFLHLLPCLPVTSIPPFIFPSVTRCRGQFLRKMWPIQFVFRLRI